MIRPILLAAAAMAVAAPALAQEIREPVVPPERWNSAAMAPDFLKTAAASDEFERRSGRIAAERGQRLEVREFGQMMVQAHTESSQMLGQAAERAGQRAPRPDLSPGHERLLRQLERAPADQFDNLYLQIQHEAHKDALGLMKTYATLGQEPELRGAAAMTAPVVEDHLKRVIRLQNGGG